MINMYSFDDLRGLKIAEYDWRDVCIAYGVPIDFFMLEW